MAADSLSGRANRAHRTGMAGDPAGARDQYTELLDIVEETLGPEDTYTLLIRTHLAYWTGMAGDPARARDLYTELLDIEKRVLGREHPDTRTTRVNLDYWIREAASGGR